MIRTSLMVVVLLFVRAAPAWGQSHPAPAESVHFVEPSAVALEGWSEAARSAFETGAGATRLQRWSDATRAFRASLQSEAHPETLLDLAVVERAQGHYRAAIEVLDTLLALGTAPDPVGVRATVDALEDHVGVLSVATEPLHARIDVDGQRVIAGDVSLDEGAHIVAVEAAGFVRHVSTIHVRAEARTVLEVRLTRRGPSPAWVWGTAAAASGMGIAITIVAAVFALHHDSSPSCGTLNVCITMR